MGDECFDILFSAVADITMVRSLFLNINRNCITPEALAKRMADLDNLAHLTHLEIDAKRNLKRIEDREAVRQMFNGLRVKSKKVDL